MAPPVSCLAILGPPVLALLLRLFLQIPAFPVPEPLGGWEAPQDDSEDGLYHHEVKVRLSPSDHRLTVDDCVTLPPSAWVGGGSLRFLLNASLEVHVAQDDLHLEPDEVTESEGREAGIALRAYRLGGGPDRDPDGSDGPLGRKVCFKLQGTIHHPLTTEEEEYARSFSRTPGLIGEHGVVLSGSSAWLPRFGDELSSFRLTVEVPSDWRVVSQGQRVEQVDEDDLRRVTWDCPHPMEEVYLIANRFFEYSQRTGPVPAFVFLREPDPNLAHKYLEATTQYLEMYRRLIGPYPYAKFALVENFWETGYGMPSFTLLGPKIIRFPFILHSSYPHEILHNWWGNSVFVDSRFGNWCEGLTAYLADHLVKEGEGRGVEYRRDALKRYRDHVRRGKDFPLREFRSRHSSASEAVGYGKSLMLWHMLRRDLGDDVFGYGLRRFYERFRFHRASFDDLQRTFSEVSGKNLEAFFRQWIERTGAPSLSVSALRVGSERVRITVRQDQAGDPYELTVPLAVTVAGESEVRIFDLELKARETTQEFAIAGDPLRVDLDPYHDIFRRLHRNETPASFGELFGAEKVTLVLPNADAPLAKAWAAFADEWQGASAVSVVHAEDLEKLPADSATWVLGRDNRWGDSLVAPLAAHGAAIRGEEIVIGDLHHPERGHSFAFVVRHPFNPELAMGWVGADHALALPGLARKLPHYGKYSYLVFTGDEPSNVAKGQWGTVDSPLVVSLADAKPAFPSRAALPSRTPLAQRASVFDSRRLADHVQFLADDRLEGRGIGGSGLAEAGEYIARAFAEAGLTPAGDEGHYFQSWSEPGGPQGEDVTLRNVVGVLPGRNPEWTTQSVVVAAHYDHLGRGWPSAREGEAGKIHNGADDNASGVAVLIELARLLGSGFTPDRSVVFTAFSGEEWDLKGSRHYVTSMKRYPVRDALAMINLDSIGRLGAGKLLILGCGSAREWKHIVMGVGYTTGVDAEAIESDPGGSDQRSFHEAGVPAVQVFTGAHEDYHRPSDDADKVDAEGLARAATFVREMLVYLCARHQPLTTQLPASRAGVAPADGRARDPSHEVRRRVRLGTVPDFGYTGTGVRVSSVQSDSPAESAGLRAGDILVAIDGEEIDGLRAYSNVLKRRKPGDRIEIRLRRGNEERTLTATLDPY